MELYKKLNIDDVIYENIVKRLKRVPNDFELYLFSAMHSEHCGYMHSKKYLKNFYTDNNFKDENAGCINIKDHCVFFKIESHNHPCAIEPYQGSMTGIGGIVRDILALGCKPIALLNSIKFSNPNEIKTKYYIDEVVRGISTYGNCIGVPTINGETIFNDCYKNLPIVNVFAAGIVKKNEIKLSKATEDCLILLVGSKTGIDGLNGANFASSVINKNSKRESVQIADPYLKKKLIDVTYKITKLNETIACQDLGASGILSSTSEMGQKGNCSVELHLENVHTQTNSITPVEIMLSESQERMAFIIKKEGLNKIKKILDDYEIEYSIIGKTLKGKRYKVYYKDNLLANLDINVLTKPYLYTLKKENKKIEKSKKQSNNPKEQFKKILNDYNFSSKKYIYSQFDSDVQARTCFSSKENSIGVQYLKETNTFLGYTIKSIINQDCKNNTINTFLYCYRKLVASGFEPKGLTNCLNFPNPNDLNTQSDFLNSVNTLKKLSKKYKIPVVSGNVSFYNENKITNNKIIPTVTFAFLGTSLKDRILEPKINPDDEIFILKDKNEIKKKEIIFDLIEKHLITSAKAPGSFGIIGTILKNCLFYNLGFNIKTIKDGFIPYNPSYILFTSKDKKEKLKNYLKKSKITFYYSGKVINDKIIFDGLKYDIKKINKIYQNKLDDLLK